MLIVSTSLELLQALQVCVVSISLLAGSYGDLSHSNTQCAQEVTVQSADQNNPASFSSVRLGNIENLTFDGVVFDYVYKAGDVHWLNAVSITGLSRNITIRNSVFDGDVVSGTGTSADGFGNARGLSVDGRGGASNITVEDNEFFNFLRGAVFGGGIDGLVVRGNDIHTMRSDGLKATVGRGRG